MKIDCPEPGIHRNIPFAKYLEWDAVSNSSMQPVLKSMAHYRERPEIEESPAMRLGTLVHTGRFEPERIGQTYVVMPAFENQVRKPDGSKYDSPKASKAYKELVDGFKSDKANIGKEVVTQSMYDSMLEMVAVMAADDRATGYLTGGDYEVSIVAQDPVTGLMCKGRIDHLHIRKARIGDLKTTADGSCFEDVIERRSYHRQMAFYTDLLSWLPEPIEIDECCIVAVENTAPYCVRSAPLPEYWIDAGRDQYRECLNEIAESLRTNKWPGYASPQNYWIRPAWAERASNKMPVNLTIGGQSVSVK